MRVLIHRLTWPSSLAVVLMLWAVPASASILFDSNGFESPAYDPLYLPSGGYTGQLEGQPGGGPPHWQVANPSAPTAVVENTVFAPGGGTQAVKLTRVPSPTQDPSWGVKVGPVAPSTVTVSWDMLVEPSAANPFGPFFGVQVYGLPGGSGSLLASLGVDATTGDVLVQYPSPLGIQDTGGTKVTLGIVPSDPAANWNHFELLLDYATQLYSVFLNGAATPIVPPIPFIDGPFTTFSDADLVGLSLGSDVAGAAYFDNYQVAAASAVPEPASLIMWGSFVVLALLSLRRDRILTILKAGFSG